MAYPGYDKEEFRVKSSELRMEEVKKKYILGDSYIIYIGTIQPRKNIVRLMEVVSRIEDLELVIVGKIKGEGREGWKYEETLQTPSGLGIEDRVKFLGFIPTEDLPFLLTGANAFILPSLWEGFGITVLEAMASGIPVIVSNASSLPEVVGSAGLLVDPYSTDQIEQAIRTIITDKKLKQRLSKLGIKQVEKFSWDKMARVVLKVFESI